MLKTQIKRLIDPLWKYRWTTLAVRFFESFKYHSTDVWDTNKGNKKIFDALSSGKPQAIGKIGSGELQAIRKYLQYRELPNWQNFVFDY